MTEAPSDPRRTPLNELIALGWNDFYQNQQNDELAMWPVGRVIHEEKNKYRISTGESTFWAECSGRMLHHAVERADLPAVGDWVALYKPDGSDLALIQHVYERRSKFSRKQAGEETREQIVAANIDTVFLVNALNEDFNVRRIERYLTLAWESNATPVVLLTKADLCDNPAPFVAEVESVAFGVPVHVVSALQTEGLEQLAPYAYDGQTIALLGSSGVGKSTLVNALMGSYVQKTQDIREDDAKGRHTTTSRTLFFLPQGGMLIDTPGMRELQLWDSDGGLQHTFKDIEDLTQQCRFFDCTHEGEPGCAIQAALDSGDLDRGRYQSYQKLLREQAFLERKQDQRAYRENKRHWKSISIKARALTKAKQKGW